MSFARRLMPPVSKDTLLQTIRRRAARPAGVPTVIGIDDWAYKRGQRYGTLVCDLEHRQVVTLLPDRDNGTVEAWLSQRPEPPRDFRRLQLLREWSDDKANPTLFS